MEGINPKAANNNASEGKWHETNASQWEWGARIKNKMGRIKIQPPSNNWGVPIEWLNYRSNDDRKRPNNYTTSFFLVKKPIVASLAKKTPVTRLPCLQESKRSGDKNLAPSRFETLAVSDLEKPKSLWSHYYGIGVLLQITEEWTNGRSNDDRKILITTQSFLSLVKKTNGSVTLKKHGLDDSGIQSGGDNNRAPSRFWKPHLFSLVKSLLRDWCLNGDLT